MIVKDPDLMARMHDEIGYCEHCDAGGPRLELHHIFGRGQGGGTRLDIRINLVMLCPECHDDAQRYQIAREDLLAIAAEREIYRIRRLPKGSELG